MDRLTRSEIETLIDDLIVTHPIYTPQLRALREQSLSQEAVRDEALEEAAKCAENVYGGFTANIRTSEFEQELVRDAYGPWVLNAEIATAIRALKREPNAATQALPEGQREVLGATSGGNQGPAPAAPDVASMVKRLEELQSAWLPGVGECYPITLAPAERAALFARLGQGWIPSARFRGTPTGMVADPQGGWVWVGEPGASDD